MALVKCPECNKDVSTQATSCPHCGYPLKHAENKSAATAQTTPIQTVKQKSSTNPVVSTSRRIFQGLLTVLIVLGLVAMVGAFVGVMRESPREEAIPDANIGASAQPLEDNGGQATRNSQGPEMTSEVSATPTPIALPPSESAYQEDSGSIVMGPTPRGIAARREFYQDIQTNSDAAKLYLDVEISIEGHYEGHHGHSVVITGTVRNLRELPLESVGVHFSIFDADGNKVGDADDLISSLDGGGTWKFKVVSIQEDGEKYRFDGIDSGHGELEAKVEKYW